MNILTKYVEAMKAENSILGLKRKRIENKLQISPWHLWRFYSWNPWKCRKPWIMKSTVRPHVLSPSHISECSGRHFQFHKQIFPYLKETIPPAQFQRAQCWSSGPPMLALDKIGQLTRFHLNTWIEDLDKNAKLPSL